MTIPCDSCKRFTNDPDNQEFFCNNADCPARQKTPKLVVQFYMRKLHPNDTEIKDVKEISLIIDNKKYKFIKE